MEFWGVEIKSGEPLKIQPEDDMVIHLSQACLGETKIKGNEPVHVFVKVGEQKLVLGTLSSDKFPQLSFDLVFEQEFELSHNWKNGSIHFCGYQTAIGDQFATEEGDFNDFGESDEEEEEEEDVIPEPAAIQNGKAGQKGEQAKPATVSKSAAAAAKPVSSQKPKGKVALPVANDDDSDDDDDDSSEDGEGSEDDSDQDMTDSDDSDELSDEETPKKPEVSKKRPNDSAVKTPVSSKKAKANSPKSDGKKVSGHTDTPHPAKKGGKTPATPATADKSKAQTPKSAGVSCKSCSKTFGSDKALESHTKAKHA